MFDLLYCLSVLTRCEGSEEGSASVIRWNTIIMKTTLLGRQDEANLHPWTDSWLSKNCPLTALWCFVFPSLHRFLDCRFYLSTDLMLTQCHGLASACRMRTHFSLKKYDNISERVQKFPLIVTSPNLSMPPSDWYTLQLFRSCNLEG